MLVLLLVLAPFGTGLIINRFIDKENRSIGISYIFAGETAIDVKLALFKLKHIIGCETLLLEGGSIINGSFERADTVDELSLVTAPVIAGKDSKPLFMDADIKNFELIQAENENGNLILNYKRK